MAQGTVKTFDKYKKTQSDGSHDLDNDSFKVMLLSVIPTAGAAVIDSSAFTEVTAGGGYTAGGKVATMTWLENPSGTGEFKSTVDIVWTAAAGSPTDIRAALFYNTTHTGSTDAIGWVDLTPDGSTPISLVAGNITIKSGIVYSSA